MKTGWQTKKLGMISRISYGYTEKASIQEVGPRFLRITDIQDGDVNWNAVPFCKVNRDDLAKFKLADGDIVFARTGATTGKSFLIKNPPNSVFASYLIKVQPQLGEVSPRFFTCFFNLNAIGMLLVLVFLEVPKVDLTQRNLVS